MTKAVYSRFNSIQNRMLLLFLMLISIILGITLVVVQSSTYAHSTKQLNDLSQTSSVVVKDNIELHGQLMLQGLSNLVKDFSVKKLYANVKEDPESLQSAMVNQQTRIQADFYIMMNDKSKVVSSSHEKYFSVDAPPEKYSQAGFSWLQHQGTFYLVKSAPLRFVETANRINGWVMMGVEAERLIGNELMALTKMHVNLVLEGPPNKVIASTQADSAANLFEQADIIFSQEIKLLTLGDESYIYASFNFGLFEDKGLNVVLLRLSDEAYLSYQNFLSQLVVLLFLAALLSLVAALLLSRGITRPIAALVDAAHKIQQGINVEFFPKSSTNEINDLSIAVKDMQEGISLREAKINRLAYFDKLTNLPNRLHFTEELERLIQEHDSLAVLVLDMDRFKEINDTVGHETGDKLIKMIASRLGQLAEENAFCARIGGDEFALVCPGKSPEHQQYISENIVKLFEQAFVLDGLVLDVNFSLGLAMYPTHAQSAQRLMQCADIAMYSCKATHKDYVMFDPSLDKHSLQRLNLMSELKEALNEGQLDLHYQPKLSLENHEILSLECLIRWTHPVHGFVPPDEFIPLAEQTGAIRYVTQWGLREALQQQKHLKSSGYDITMAVNVSAIDLVDMTFPTFVSQLITEFGSQPEKLTLEVTESAVMSDPELAIRSLQTLSHMGIKLSIDDFGTGYSSMAQLKKMPVNELKIDKAFVLELAQNQDDQVMVKTLVALAQNLGLETVAEGVEDKNALDFLRQIGCTKAQGYYLSKALPIDQFEQWLANFNSKDYR